MNLKQRIIAAGAAVLAFFTGLFAFLFQNEKNKNMKKKLEEVQEENKALKNGEKAYAEFKKDKEDLVRDAVRGDPDSITKLMQDTSETGSRRNKS